MAKPSPLILNPHGINEPAIEQAPVNGWAISWNPDTKRFHVDLPKGHAHEHETVKTYAELRNARAYAKTHSVPV